ncbi:helix-turn-helix domain-containing protein [Novosphingobium album (ex Liu et al. 2023)]|uniref:Helix-turn-helix transcriptional regulator n=1 Tax=Novosphingobium album (ex Liu et al. 2023) TaxID=3031130 RepID=A0ABT5WWW7_9SPHN|nr:helix-turn-helix transcriptional regulator [Novosphingobium album (ex Liu et al. 2023)]MDE8654393.1 helix-turn-helix transcriptional regulator [Novosphingobium album (ex Liu et al. 2023)]
MAIAAHLDETAQPAGGRREPRRNLRLETLGALASGEAANVLVHNVSTTGLLVESDIALTVGEAIALELPEAGATLAHVIWTSGRLFGCQFDTPIGTAALSAARLRSAVGEPIELGERPAAGPEESFGMRLQRLRAQARLSLAALAARLGVSKPTVWAWEQGRARPVESRMAELAEALNVSLGELLPERDDTGRRELLARSREDIATAFGTSPDRVRILIEL